MIKIYKTIKCILDQVSLVTLVAPYKAKIVNNSAQVFKYDGVNYTLIIEDINLNFEKAAILFLKVSQTVIYFQCYHRK